MSLNALIILLSNAVEGGLYLVESPKFPLSRGEINYREITLLSLSLFGSLRFGSKRNKVVFIIAVEDWSSSVSLQECWEGLGSLLQPRLHVSYIFGGLRPCYLKCPVGGAVVTNHSISVLSELEPRS